MALGRGNIEIDVSARLDTSGLVRQVSAAEKRIQPLNLKLNDKGFRQPLGRISGDLDEFEKSLDASVARTLAFGAAVGVINSLANAFKGMVSSAVEVEKALMDVNVILNLSSSALERFSADLFETAKNTGQSFQVVSEAAVELSRQGLGAEETLSRINDAMILTRLSGMDAAKSVETLTAAVNSFGSTALTTTELVNKLATVDAAFAVSTEDLANALARAGSTAQGAKVSLDELLAAVTSVQQITARGGSVIGNAFKSIFTRIQRAGVREALEEIGVATTDATGNIRNAIDIIKDYAGVYKTLSDSQRSYTDELVAGVFQINNFKALVKDLSSDYSIYDRALKQSNSATDEAVRRNEQLQSTLSSLINESSVNVKALAASLGELVATPAIENLLKIFNSFSGAIANALEGEGMIKTFLMGIGRFIAGPGLIILTVAFVKLFKFITGQAGKAMGQIFNLGSAKNKVAETEAKISHLLQNNYKLYEAISNQALNHEQREELVLQTIQSQNRAYQQQQTLISSLAGSRILQASITPTKAKAQGFIPNYANGVHGAIESERQAISVGTGGASKGAKTKVLRGFPTGGGKKETVVANTDEVIVPNYGGSRGSAIFNKDMIKKAGGAPQGAVPVSEGFVPNFIKSGAGVNTGGKIGFLNTSPYEQALSYYDQKGTVDFQSLLGGIGMITAKGPAGKMDKGTVQNPITYLGSKGAKDIITQLAGSKLNDAEKSELVKRLSKRAKVTYSNIGISPISSMNKGENLDKIKGQTGALNDIIGPYIAQATAAVSSKIYGKLFGDEVKASQLVSSVYNAATTESDKISTVGVEGSIFEAAIRLGSKESSKGFGGDTNATWDFEENSNISPDLKSMFFDSMGYGSIARADAKRQASDNLINEVIEKAYSEKGSASWMRERLNQYHTQQFKPLVSGAIKGKASAGEQLKSAAGGFIPNLGRPEGVTEAVKNQLFQIESNVNRLANSKGPNGLLNWFNGDRELAERVKAPDETYINHLRTKGSKRSKAFIKVADEETIGSGKERIKTLVGNIDSLNSFNLPRNIANIINGLASKPETYTKAQLNKKVQEKLGKPISKTKVADMFALDTAKRGPLIKALKGFGGVQQALKNKAKITNRKGEGLTATKDIGDKFEDALSVLGGVPFLKSPDALDFSRQQGRQLKIPAEVAKQINFDSRSGYGDAESGSGHKWFRMLTKIIRELGDAGTLSRITNFMGDGPIGLYDKAQVKTHAFPDIVAKGTDNMQVQNTTFGAVYKKVKKSSKMVKTQGYLDRLIKAKYKMPYDQLSKEDKIKLDTRPLNFGYAIDDINLEGLKSDGRTKRSKKVEAYFNLRKEHNRAAGFIPNFADITLDEYVRKEFIGKKFMDLNRMVGSSWQSRAISGSAIGMAEETKFKNGLFAALAQTFDTPMNKRVGTGWNPVVTKKNWAKVNVASKKKLGSQWMNLLQGSPEEPRGIGEERFGSQDAEDPDKKLWKDMMSRRATGGFIPQLSNFAQGMAPKSKLGQQKRMLDMSSFYPQAGSGAKVLKNILKDIINSAKAGRAYTDVAAGDIVGPRIPKLIVEGHKLLERRRAAGVDLPKMKITGEIFPAMLMNKINKFAEEEADGIPQSPVDYKKGEEEEVAKYLKILSGGRDLKGMSPINLRSSPFLSQGFAEGFLPNFIDTSYNQTVVGGEKTLDISQFFPKSGKMALSTIAKDIMASAEAGNPYTSIEAREIVGPRIPSMIIKAKKLLDSMRAKGKDIPKMKLKGWFEPSFLMGAIKTRKGVYDSKVKSATAKGAKYKPSKDISPVSKKKMSSSYLSGEEKVVEQAIRILGADPSSSDNFYLKNSPLLSQGFAGGFIPNFGQPMLKPSGDQFFIPQKLGATIGNEKFTIKQVSDAILDTFKLLDVSAKPRDSLKLATEYASNVNTTKKPFSKYVLNSKYNFGGDDAEGNPFRPLYTEDVSNSLKGLREFSVNRGKYKPQPLGRPALITPNKESRFEASKNYISGFIPNFVKAMGSKKTQAASELLPLQQKWIQAVQANSDLGKTMGLGKGGTKNRGSMPQVSDANEKTFINDLRGGTGMAGEMLGGKKVKVATKQKVSVSSLKATQGDIYASNVLGKLIGAFGTKWDQPGKKVTKGAKPWLTMPIMVSKENKILDGHHRWATLYARDAIEDGILGNLNMEVNRIGLPIQQLLQVTDAYSGAKHSGAGTTAARGFIPNFAKAMGSKKTQPSGTSDSKGTESPLQRNREYWKSRLVSDDVSSLFPGYASLGIGRGNMPQFDDPVKQELLFEKLRSGEITGKPVSVTKGKTMSAKRVKGTQDEIVGPKISKHMEGAYGKDAYDPDPKKTTGKWMSGRSIMVGSKGRILDGHHSAFAQKLRLLVDGGVGRSKYGKESDLQQAVTIIGAPIASFIKMLLPGGKWANLSDERKAASVDEKKKAPGGKGTKLKSAGGLIPNFADALQQAIGREKSALKSQGSNAKVYVDQDNRLKGKDNPAGLLVANKRDEPRSGSQGVNRAVANRIDPKRHGSARGMIPNFVSSFDALKASNVESPLPSFKSITSGKGNLKIEMPKIEIPNLDETTKELEEDLDKVREILIREFNELAEAIEKGTKELGLSSEDSAKQLDKLSKKGEQLEGKGVKVKAGMESGALKRPDLGDKEESVVAKSSASSKELIKTSKAATMVIDKQAKANKKLERNGANALAKMMGLQMAVSQMGSAFDMDLSGFQGAMGVVQGLDMVMPGVMEKMGKLGPVLQIAAMAGGLLLDMYHENWDAEKKLMKALEKDIEARKNSIDTITKNIEKIDEFANSTAKFSEATRTGDIESAGKFMQSIFTSAQDMSSLDPKAFEEVIASLGDTEELNKAVDSFKKAASLGKNIKQVENDIAKMMLTITKQMDEDQFLGIGEISGEFIADMKQFGDQFKAIGKSLTQNLDDDAALALARAMKGFNVDMGDASESLLSFEGIFGKFDDATKKSLKNNKELARGILQEIKIQNQYQAAVIRAKIAFTSVQKPINVLNNNLNELALALDTAAVSSQAAFDTLSEVGKIQSGARIESLKASGTVSSSDLAAGQAASEIKNSMAKAAQEQSASLKSFASEMIKSSKEGTTVLSGSLKHVINGISSGEVSNQDAVKALIEIQKTGTTKDKEAANKTLVELRKINQTQVKNAAITNANLKAQLQKLDSQALNAQRTTTIGASQVEIFEKMNESFEGVKGSSLKTLAKISEMTQAIKLLESLGADQDILAELKESNAQLNQLEALKVLAKSTTGQDFGATSLEELQQEIDGFVARGAFRNLEGAAKDSLSGIRSAVKKGVDAMEDSGIKGEDDVVEATLIAFDSDALTELSEKMAEAVSSGLASGLGLGDELANSLNEAIDIDVVARAIEETAVENATNAVKNAESQKKLNDSMLEAMRAADFSKMASSSSSLERAAISLEKAAKIMMGDDNADGFVPNFAPTDSVSRALSTERDMGAKRPVVDSHPSVGTYVRDAATQPNFGAVKRDHPEGLKQASENSRVAQSVINANAFMPEDLMPEAFTPNISGISESALGSARGPRQAVKNSRAIKPTANSNGFVPNFGPGSDEPFEETLGNFNDPRSKEARKKRERERKKREAEKTLQDFLDRLPSAKATSADELAEAYHSLDKSFGIPKYSHESTLGWQGFSSTIGVEPLTKEKSGEYWTHAIMGKEGGRRISSGGTLQLGNIANLLQKTTGLDSYFVSDATEALAQFWSDGIRFGKNTLPDLKPLLRKETISTKGFDRWGSVKKFYEKFNTYSTIRDAGKFFSTQETTPINIASLQNETVNKMLKQFEEPGIRKEHKGRYSSQGFDYHAPDGSNPMPLEDWKKKNKDKLGAYLGINQEELDKQTPISAEKFKKITNMPWSGSSLDAKGFAQGSVKPIPAIELYEKLQQTGQIGARFMEYTSGNTFGGGGRGDEDSWPSKLIDGYDMINNDVKTEWKDQAKYDTLVRHLISGNISGSSDFPEAAEYTSRLSYANAIKEKFSNQDSKYLVPASLEITDGEWGKSIRMTDIPEKYSIQTFNDLLEETKSSISWQERALNTILTEPLTPAVIRSDEPDIFPDIEGGERSPTYDFRLEAAQNNLKELKKFQGETQKYAPFFEQVKSLGVDLNPFLDPVDGKTDIDSYFKKPFWIDSAAKKITEGEGSSGGSLDLNDIANHLVAVSSDPKLTAGKRYNKFMKDLFPEEGKNRKTKVEDFLKNKYPDNLPEILRNLDADAAEQVSGERLSALRAQQGKIEEELKTAQAAEDAGLTEEEKKLPVEQQEKIRALKTAEIAKKTKLQGVTKEQIEKEEKRLKGHEEGVKGVDELIKERTEKHEKARITPATEERNRLYTALLGANEKERRDEVLAGDESQAWYSRRMRAEQVMQNYQTQLLPNLIGSAQKRLDSLINNPHTTRQENIPFVEEQLEALRMIESRYSGNIDSNEEGIAHLMGITDTNSLEMRYDSSLKRDKPIHPKIYKAQDGYWEEYLRKKEQFSDEESLAEKQMGGKERGNYLDKYKDPISKDREMLGIFSEIQPTKANGGTDVSKSAWMKKFRNARGRVGSTINDTGSKAYMLARIGLTDEEIGFGDPNKEGVFEKFFGTHEFARKKSHKGFSPEEILKSFASSADEDTRFMVSEMLMQKQDWKGGWARETDDETLGNWGETGGSGQWLINRIRELGMPFHNAQPITHQLERAELPFIRVGNELVSTPAVDKQYITPFAKEVQRIQKAAIIDELNASLPEDDTSSLKKDASLADILGFNEDRMNDLWGKGTENGPKHSNPYFLNYLIREKQEERAKNIMSARLNNKKNVENYEEWEKLYGGVGKGGGTLIGDVVDNVKYGPPSFTPTVKEAKAKSIEDENGVIINPFAQFVGGGDLNTTPLDAAQKVIPLLERGKNMPIDSLLSDDFDTFGHPLQDLFGHDRGDGFEYNTAQKFRDWFYGNFGSMEGVKGVMGNYAPFGYTKGEGADFPDGDISAMNDFITQLISDKKEVEKKKADAKKQPKDGAVAKAGGFVPNFSRIAGEIAASKTAGYKTPVRPSQVKSINIPGVGKSSYNTQESVFKAKGMSQPFIRPPSNSKAAKPYAKKVQKRFNFNPYGKQSADGFVPNFFQGPTDSQFEEAVKRFSSSVGMFERSGSSLGEAFDRMDFTKFSDASNNILEASKEFTVQSENIKDAADSLRGAEPAQGANQAEINFEPLTKASSEISKSVSELSKQLRAPLTIDASGLSDVVKTMQTIQLSVNVPSVDVNVKGVAGAADQIKQSVGQEVENRVKALLAEQSFVTAIQINDLFGTHLS